MASVSRPARRADRNGNGAAPQTLRPWGDFLVGMGRDQTDRTPVNGRGVTLDDAIRQAVHNVAGDIRHLGITDPALVWEGSDLKAVVVATPAGPRVTRFDWPAEVLALDEAADAYHQAREACRIDQRDQGGNVRPLRSAMFDRMRALNALAFRIHDGADRDPRDATPFAPFVIETPRFLVYIEPYNHDLCSDDEPEYLLRECPATVIPRPALTTEGGAL